jgi:hypothetical protein
VEDKKYEQIRFLAGSDEFRSSKANKQMKLRLLLPTVALTGLIAPATAQVPNGGFENWTTVGTYQDPSQWITFNALTSLGGSDPSCQQGTPGAVGNYYATITTRNTTLGLIQGIISVGDATSGNIGFAYSSRPAALTGQWQYGIQAGDSALVAVQLTKWNSATQSEDVIGVGAVEVGGSLTGWNTLNVPINYTSSQNPDTAFIAIASSMNSPVDGSFVKVDALAFGGTPAGISETEAAVALRVYPSPATDRLTITAEEPIAEVFIMDMTGRTVLRQEVNAGTAVLNVADYHSGRYLLQLRMADGKRMVRSFIKG